MKDNPEVLSWGTWSMEVQSVGQQIWEKPIWREVSPVLDISGCLKDIIGDACGSERSGIRRI